MNEHLQSSPDVLGGAMVISGTRLDVWTVAARLAGSDTIEDLARDYPDVDPKAFIAADQYAREHPRPKGAKPWRAS
jgi:uncharacterized protein (DUF433 family)